jgi:alanine racemase
MYLHRPEHSGALLSIDLDAISANWRLLNEMVGQADCAAVVKADAYGLDATRVAPALARAGCRHFFVAHLDEAIALRPHLPGAARLYVLHGAPPGVEAEFLAHDLIPVLNCLSQVDAWSRLGRSEGRDLPALLQVDTGMSRLGLAAAELAAIVADPGRLRGIDLCYLMSHLACAEAQDNPANALQLQNFRAALVVLPQIPGCFANSSGIFLGRDYHFGLVRPGAALYGIAPVAGAANPMRPVIRLQGKVIQTRRIEAGAGVGYSLTWRARQASRIATVAVGYADGYLRSLSGRGIVRVNGVDLPQVGNVSMDTITIDISALPAEALQTGSLVDLIDPSNGIDAVAERAGTIGYEILTALGSRYARRYIGG